MQRLERTASGLTLVDPIAGLELRLARIRRELRNEKIARYAVYVGLFAFCTAFWGGLIWLLER